MLSFCLKNYFHGIKDVNANVQCLCILYTNFQNVPEINVGGVELLVQALSQPHVELQRAVTLKGLNLRP